jgi:large subunit ribosomal protein L29
MKFKDIKIMKVEELKSKLEELKKELIKNNAQVATGTNPKSPGQVKQIKKSIAKILMVLDNKKEASKKTS